MNADGFQLTVASVPSVAHTELATSVFLHARNRPRPIHQHFPWWGEPNAAHYISCTTRDDVVGGLVLREQLLSAPFKMMMLGLVAVAPAFRERGIASAMMTRADELAHQQGATLTVLWARQHGLYRKHGYQLADPWLFGTVHTASRHTAPQDAHTDTGGALPVFALARSTLRGDGVTVTLLRSAEGWIVADYAGDAMAAAALLTARLPGVWHLNVRTHDPLIAALRDTGATLSLQPAALQMLKWHTTHHTDAAHHDDGIVAQARPSLPLIPVHERI